MYREVGVEYLRNLLLGKKIRVELRNSFYEGKNNFEKLNISMPGRLQTLRSVNGWSAKAVDSFTQRLNFHRFKHDPFDLDGIFDECSCRPILVEDGITSASIGACSFVYIHKNDRREVRMQIIDAGNATGIIDPDTRMLFEGYAVLQRDTRTGKPILEAHFLPNKTVYYDKTLEREYTVENPTGYPLLVPIINKPTSKRPFGYSRITRPLMYYQEAAQRTMMRSEVSAEFYSFPQKYATGLPQDVDMDDAMTRWSAAMSAMLAFYADKDGNDTVKLGQFQQQSMTPYTDQLKMFASLAAAETGLTLDDMGFPTANPPSDEALISQHDGLNLACAKATGYFGVSLKNAGFVAMCLIDKSWHPLKELANVKTMWKPSFIPSASSLAQIGDGIIKINNALEGYIDEDGMFELTGIEGAQL